MTDEQRHRARTTTDRAEAPPRMRLGARRRAGGAVGLAAAVAALFCLGGGTAEAQSNVFVAQGDGQCPAGARPLTYREALANREAVCRQLGEWYIARLDGGGSMDGPGYRCQVRPADARPLGHTLCVGDPPPNPPPAGERADLVGSWVAAHPDWRDTIELRPDGRFQRESGTGGTWSLEGNELVLAWDHSPAERLVQIAPDAYRAPSNGFVLVRRPPTAVLNPPNGPRVPPFRPALRDGTYALVRGGRRDTVTVLPDGRYFTSGGDGGFWSLRGHTLLLSTLRGDHTRLVRVGENRYASPSGDVTLTLVREGDHRPYYR